MIADPALHAADPFLGGYLIVAIARSRSLDNMPRRPFDWVVVDNEEVELSKVRQVGRESGDEVSTQM